VTTHLASPTDLSTLLAEAAVPEGMVRPRGTTARLQVALLAALATAEEPRAMLGAPLDTAVGAVWGVPVTNGPARHASLVAQGWVTEAGRGRYTLSDGLPEDVRDEWARIGWSRIDETRRRAAEDIADTAAEIARLTDELLARVATIPADGTQVTEDGMVELARAVAHERARQDDLRDRLIMRERQLGTLSLWGPRPLAV
jgi:hypothetical protein